MNLSNRLKKGIDKVEKDLIHILDEINSLKEGLLLKQTYLRNGTVPENLPHSIFLNEDIEQLDYIKALLKELLSCDERNIKRIY